MKRIPISVPCCTLLLAVLSGCTPRTPATGKTPAAAPQAASFTVSLEVSDPTLGQFSGDRLEGLRRYLAASAGWRVTELDGIPVAVRREPADESTPDAGKRRITADGFYFKHQPWRRYRALLRFGSQALPIDPEWKSVLTPATVGHRDALLQVQPANLPDYRSYLILSAGGPVTLEIMEESMDTGRSTTRRLLQETHEELKKVLAALPAGQEEIRLQNLAPKESVRSGAPVLKVESAHVPGAYHLYGYVNPGALGYSYARALSEAGQAIAPDAVRAQTLEYVGWSKQAQSQYFFNSQLRLEQATPRPARVELWFHPETGAERKLLEAKLR